MSIDLSSPQSSSCRLADLVEVSPPYDTTGNTSLLAANLIFEMLCSFPGCKRR